MRNKLKEFVGVESITDLELVNKLKRKIEFMGEDESIWMRYFHHNENIKRKRRNILHHFRLDIQCTTEQALKEFEGFVEFFDKQKGNKWQ